MNKLLLLTLLGLFAFPSFGAVDKSIVSITVYHMELPLSQAQERKILAGTAKYFLARAKTFQVRRPFKASGIQPGVTQICIDFAKHNSLAGSYVKYIRRLFTGGFNFSIVRGQCR